MSCGLGAMRMEMERQEKLQRRRQDRSRLDAELTALEKIGCIGRGSSEGIGCVRCSMDVKGSNGLRTLGEDWSSEETRGGRGGEDAGGESRRGERLRIRMAAADYDGRRR